jgi:hypothetical protein
MAWTRIVNSYWYGHYHIDVYYETHDNPRENYTDVTVSKMRIVHDGSGYYLYNYYPVSNPNLAADFGLYVNGINKIQNFQANALTGTRELSTDQPVTARIYHNNSGQASVNIGIYLDVAGAKAPPSYIGWVTKSIALTIFDRNKPTVNAKVTAIKNESIDFDISSNSAIEKVEYQINNGEWQNTNSTLVANQIKKYTIGNLEPNTSYSINWKLIKSYNGLSQTALVQCLTDADAPTINDFSITNKTKTSITIQIDAAGTENNNINGYSYSLDGKVWSGYTNSNIINITDLQKNTSYRIYVKVKSQNGKISNILNKLTKTLSDPPYIQGIQVLLRKTRKIRVQAINYGAQAGIKEIIYRIDSLDKEIISNSWVEFTELTPKTEYIIQCTIKDIDDQTATTSIIVITKADVSQNFTPIASDITNNSFRITLPEIEADLSEIIYHINENNYYSLDKTKVFSGLKNFTSYTISIDVTNDEGIKASSKTIEVKTLPAIPKFSIEITKIKPREFTFEPILIKSPGVNLSECYYSITNTNPDIKTDNLPQTIIELKPNTKYQLYVKVIDKDNQYYITSIEVKTKEDKWVQISINGAPFQKYNTYLIFSNGEKKKIEKSKRKIII